MIARYASYLICNLGVVLFKTLVCLVDEPVLKIKIGKRDLVLC